ncbi:MAG: translocation/assembly module TamB domain-containing protein [Saprospiraceae bacterium]
MSEHNKNILPQDEEVVEVVQASKKKQRSLFFRLLRLLFRTAFLLGLLLVILRILISIPVVQNKLIQVTTKQLAKRLDTRVEIDEIQLDFFDHLDLHGIYIEDFHGDTLLYTEQLHADIKLFSLINKKIVIEDLVFENTRFNFHTYPSEYYPEIRELIQRLSKPYEPGPPKDNPTFYFDCNKVYFDNLRFGFQVAFNGSKLLVNVKDLILKFGQSDFYERRLKVKSITINEPKGQFAKAIFHPIDSANYPQKHPADTINYPIDSTQAIFWHITVDDLKLNNGTFKFDNVSFKNYFDLPFDPQHFDFEDVNLKIKDIKLENQKGTWEIERGIAQEKRGFKITSFKSNMMVTVDTMAFFDLALTTPESFLGDTVIFAYRHISSMGDFNNKVKMDVRSRNSVIAIQDLLIFAPQLKRNAFFRQNKEGKILFKGRLFDRVNRLKGDDLYLSIGQNATLKGSFRSRNFTKPDETLLQLSVDRLNTNMRNVKLLFPELNITEQFYKLGRISFNGTFDGFYSDFVADGNLRTDLGRAKMSINFKSPTSVGRYSGNLNLYDFDLKTWTGNDDFGNVTFKSKVSGSGATLPTLNIKIDSDIESFVYKEYPYENINIDGIFNKKSFIGEMGISDGNIDLIFDGEMNFNDTLPKFDLTSTVNHLDLKALNLSNETYTFDAQLNLNFTGDDLDNIVGQARIDDLNIETDTAKFYIDSLILRSRIDSDGSRKMSLSSEILNASLDGKYNINGIEKPLLNFIATNYPSYAKKLNIKFDEAYAQSNIEGSEKFTFKLNVFDSKNLTHLLDAKLDTITNLDVKANFNNSNNSFMFSLVLPLIKYDNIQLMNITTNANGVKDLGTVQVKVQETKINDLTIPTISLKNELYKDTLNFQTSVASITDIFSSLNINGAFYIVDDQFQVNLDSSDLKIADEKWQIEGNNYIQFGSGYVHTNNFTLQSDEKTIALNSIGDKGLQLDIGNLPLNWLDQFFTIPFLKFDGLVNATTITKDLFNITNDSILTTVFVDSFFINDDYFGELNIDANVAKLRKPLQFDLGLNKTIINDENKPEEQFLNIVGKYILPIEEMGSSFFNRPNSFNFKATAQNLPFNVAEYFVQGISGTKGKVSADLIFTGSVDNPKAKGNLRLTEAGTRVDYLQTYYRLDDVNVTAKDNFFDFSGTELLDKFGNVAYVEGGIKHRKLSNFELDLKINSNQFLLIDTEKKDNELFYGRGIGSATVEFTGSLIEPNIDINATTSGDSWMNIPLMTSNSAKAVNFIDFINPKDTAKNEKKVNFFGANLKLELNVTPQAEISLIFDESVGDIMRGRGKGNLTINVTNKGEFTMFGTYELVSGEYLFTYSTTLLSINKPFSVKKGGTITWDGSPYEAQINIDAVYKDLRTSPYNLVLEFLKTDDEIASAKRATDVELSMELRNNLMKPDISFDIAFPNLNQQIQAIVDNKMRIIKADDNELNRQAFGLVVLKSFLPSEGGNANLGTIGNTYANTVSEMFSNQLSLYVTGLVSEIVTDVDFLTGVDFDFVYQPFSDVTIDNPNEVNDVTNQFQFNTRSNLSLFNSEFIVGAGGGIENSATQGRYFTGDFVVEYIVSENGRLRLKAYNRSEPDITGNRNQTGIGASYSIEFDSFRRNKNKNKPQPILPDSIQK